MQPVNQVAITVFYAAFMALSAYATWQVGYFGIWQAGLNNGPGGWQILFDLVVACGLGSAWVVNDARARGIPAWPWLISVPLLGSIPLVTYAVARPWLPSEAAKL